MTGDTRLASETVVFDPNERWTIDAEYNASKADCSIYDGREVTGRVTHIFVSGSLVAEDGKLVGEPGHGTFLDQSIPDCGAKMEARAGSDANAEGPV